MYYPAMLLAKSLSAPQGFRKQQRAKLATLDIDELSTPLCKMLGTLSILYTPVRIYNNRLHDCNVSVFSL